MERDQLLLNRFRSTPLLQLRNRAIKLIAMARVACTCANLFQGFNLSRLKCEWSLDLDVRLDSSTFPVCLRHRIDGAARRHPDTKMFGNAPHASGMRTSTRRLPDNRRTLQHLEVVRKLFGRRESPRASQYEDGLASTITSTLNVWRRPELACLVTFSPIEVVQMDDIVEEIT